MPIDFSKIVDNVKSMIVPTAIPEEAKGDPLGYRVVELHKKIKNLIEIHTKMADELARIDADLSAFYQELNITKKPAATAAEKPAEKPKEEDKK